MVRCDTECDAHQRLSTLGTAEVQLKHLQIKMHDNPPEIGTDSCSFSSANFLTEIPGYRVRFECNWNQFETPEVIAGRTSRNWGPKPLVPILQKSLRKSGFQRDPKGQLNYKFWLVFRHAWNSKFRFKFQCEPIRKPKLGLSDKLKSGRQMVCRLSEDDPICN